MASIGTLAVNLTANVGSLQRSLANASSMVSSFARNTVSSIKAMGSATSSILSKAFSLPSLVAGGLVGGGLTWMAKLSSDAEQLKMQFEVLTGSAESGAAMFNKIQKFAVETSFSLQSAGEAARSLMASGVGEAQIIDTMRLLGDLAMGDAERLGFLSKAYTDVLNKGKLQAQEIRQFSENGVGLIAALAKMYGKTTAEILEMSEAGEIGFQDMQKALRSLTGEGGRFQNMMQRMAETTKGRFDSVMENIGILARSIADEFMPAINKALTAVNQFLTGFNAIDGSKMKVLGDLLLASFDVGMETIKLHWADMLNAMIDQVAAIDWSALLNPFAGVKIDDLRPQAGPQNLEDAQKRFNDLLAGIMRGGAAPNVNRGFGGGKEWVHRQAAPDLGGAVSGLLESLKPRAEAIEGAVAGWFARMQVKGDWLQGTLSNWLGGDREKTPEVQLAGAMEKGSAEAYSTLVRAMMSPEKDPTTQAIKDQTKELIKPWNKFLDAVKGGPMLAVVKEIPL